MIKSTNKKPIIIFAGPSGVGKGTIEKYLFEDKEPKATLRLVLPQQEVLELVKLMVFTISLSLKMILKTKLLKMHS